MARPPSGLRGRFAVVVAPPGGAEQEHTVTVDGRDTLAWERQHRLSWLATSPPTVEMLAWRCWHALHARAGLDVPWTTWLEQIVDVIPDDDDETAGDADPTHPTPGGEPS